MRGSTVCSKSRVNYSKLQPVTSSVVALLFLFIWPSVVFCALWESVGPAGGDFLASITNPADANQVTLLTSSPSPSSVYHSVDGGASWRKIGEIPTSGDNLEDISAFDFSNIFAITSVGCYHSTNGGSNWSYTAFPSQEVEACQVCVNPIDSNMVYVVARVEEDLIFFRSIDAGLTWSMNRSFVPGDFSYYYVVHDMAISKSDPRIIYIAGLKARGWSADGILLKSSDGGTSWIDISNAFNPLPYVFTCVAIDPTDPNYVYVGGPDSFYCGTVEGPDQSNMSWIRYTTDFTAWCIAIDPQDVSRIYLSDGDSIHISTNYGRTWVAYGDDCFGGIQHIEVAPANPSTIYVCTHSNFCKSLDSGQTWDFTYSINATSITAIAVAPSQPTTILIERARHGVMGSYDSGGTWTDLGYFVRCGNVCDIIINPLDENVVLALEGDG